ncbi:nucleotide-diphospho-sugar transferase [Aureococcus anophagefferens]|nr:nucleotide-diphospho-sugar transferase [Aureococcus anophagefferens]
MRAIQFTCGVALGAVLALVWVAREHEAPPLRRRLTDENCVAGAGWTGFKRAERYAALQHVDADNANHKRPGDVYASWRGPANAWVLGTNGTFDGGENALIPEACAELDVAVVNEDRCVLVSRHDEPGAVPGAGHVYRYVAEGGAWAPLSRYESGYTLGPMPEKHRVRARELLATLMSQIDAVRGELAPILAEAAEHTPAAYARTMGDTSRGAVLVMAINWGNFDLLLNFLRSACDRRVDVRNLVVFAGDDRVYGALKDVGVLTFRHEALGEFGEAAARVWRPHVLDDDVVEDDVRVSRQRPRLRFAVPGRGPLLVARPLGLLRRAARRRDVLDGRRRADGPLRAGVSNTGYYAVRATDRTAKFLGEVLMLYEFVLLRSSQQVVVTEVLAEHHARFGLTFKQLPWWNFPSGKHFHHNKAFFSTVLDGSYEPYCFHMCWTSGKVDKLKFLKQAKLWLLEPACDLKALADAAPEVRRSCDLHLATCRAHDGMA